MIYDPKLLSQVIQSKLIQASMLVGVKNADKYKKAVLIPTFLKAVDKLSDEAKESLDERVVEKYNHLVTLFKLIETEEEQTSEEQPVASPETAAEETTAVESAVPVEAVEAVGKSQEKEVITMGEPATTPPTTAPAAKKTEAKKAPPKKEGYSRIQAFCDAVKAKKSGKMDALITLANQKYVAKGGSDNTKEASWATNLGIRVLAGMGLVTLENDSFKLN